MIHLESKCKATIPQYKIKVIGLFPGSQVVKMSPSNSGSVGSIPVQEAKTPHASVAKTQTRCNIVTSSIKTLKMVHTKKILKLNKNYFLKK